jgi:tRNA (guanine37-N1)-methyltransferase
MALVEGVARLLPGVLGNEASTTEESHSPASGGLLEYPQYTRPAEFRGQGVPEVLVGGHHGEIARYRREQSLLRTRDRRPDLLGRSPAPEAPVKEAGVSPNKTLPGRAKAPR